MINLASLPTPKVIEQVDYEAIKKEIIDDFLNSMPDYEFIENSADPIVKLIEMSAYRETQNRIKQNQKVEALFLPTAKGDDLEVLASAVNVERKIIIPADENTTPITPAVFETDDDLRKRALIAWEAVTTAGSKRSYIFHALNSSEQVKDALILSPEPSEIDIFILAKDSNGQASDELVSQVSNYFENDDIRPLGDRVEIKKASIVEYVIEAELTIAPNLDGEQIKQQSLENAQKYVDDFHKIGKSIPVSGIYKALQVEGVEKVNLIQSNQGVSVSETEAPFCTSISLAY